MKKSVYSREKSWLVGKCRQLTKNYELMFGFLLTNAKRRAIIPTQLNKNSIRASGGNLNRLDYQAPCESKWWWDNYIILYSNERRTVNGWTTERRASQDDTGLLYHFGSTAFFIARIARTTKEVFSSWSGKDFFFCPIIFRNIGTIPLSRLVLYSGKKNWMTVRTGYDFAMTPKGWARRRCGETPGQAQKTAFG